MTKAYAAALSTVLLLATASAAAGQTLGLGDARRWSEFGTSSGLPSNQILEILETGSGTLWVSTTGGAAWFDGYAWVPLVDRDGLPLGRLTSLDWGRTGEELVLVARRSLYVGSSEGGFRRVPVTVDGIEPAIGDAVTDDAGRIIVSTSTGLMVAGDVHLPFEAPVDSNGDWINDRLTRTRSGAVFYHTADGLYRWKDDTWYAVIPTTVSALQVQAIREAADGPTWVYVAWPIPQKGLWRWDLDQGASRLEDPGTDAMAVMDLRPDGRPLAISGDGSPYLVGPGGWEEGAPLRWVHKEISSLHYGAGGYLWVGTEDGLFVYRTNDGRWRALAPPAVSDWNRINAIFPDVDGSTWLGTSAGLARAGTDGVIDTLPLPGLEGFTQVTGIARGGDGRLWITSGSRSFLEVVEGDRVLTLGPDQGLGGARIHRPFVDASGAVWLLGLSGSGPGGVFRTTPEGVERWPGSDSLPDDHAYDMAEGLDGSMWFATGEGLSRLRDGMWRHWRAGAELRRGNVFAVDTDPQGGAWIADRFRGVAHVDARDSVTYFTTSEGLPSDEVWDVVVGTDSRVWAATRGGLALFAAGEWRGLGSDIGVPGHALWPLVMDGDQIYIGSLSAGAAVLDLSIAEQHAPRVILDEPIVRGSSVRVSWAAHAYMGEVPPSRLTTRLSVDGGTWSAWSTARLADLVLRTGQHTVAVQARGPLARPVTETSRTFRVTPPLLLRPIVAVPLATLSALVAGLLALLWRRHRRHQQEIQSSERRYRRFFEDDLTGDCVFDRDGTIRACNRAFAEMFGFQNAEAALGTSLAGLSSDPQWFTSAWDTISSGGRIEHQQIPLLSIDGEVIRAICNMVPDSAEDGDGARGYFFNDTARMDLEDQLRQSQKMEAVGKLAGGVAHDFNNLLTAVTGYAELLDEDLEHGSPLREDVVAILEAARRAKELTSRLLAFGRRQTLDIRALDLRDVIHGMQPLLLRVGGPNLLVTTDFQDQLPAVEADLTTIEQVILNLVVNAADAMRGRGEIRIALRTASLRPREASRHEGARPGPYVVLTVEDTGTGIEPMLIDRIFEPFFTTKDIGQGTGLGLSMVYGIVLQSGGFVHVESQVGEGTRFHVYLLPAVDSIRANRPLDHPVRSMQAVVTAGGRKVLLVDDEAEVRDVVARALTRAGYTVVTVNDAASALGFLGAGEAPALIVTDVAMPGLSGPEFIDQLRSKAASIPILLISGSAADHLPGGGPPADVDFLQKPFRPSELVAVVDDILVRKG